MRSSCLLPAGAPDLASPSSFSPGRARPWYTAWCDWRGRLRQRRYWSWWARTPQAVTSSVAGLDATPVTTTTGSVAWRAVCRLPAHTAAHGDRGDDRGMRPARNRELASAGAAFGCPRRSVNVRGHPPRKCAWRSRSRAARLVHPLSVHPVTGASERACGNFLSIRCMSCRHRNWAWISITPEDLARARDAGWIDAGRDPHGHLANACRAGDQCGPHRAPSGTSPRTSAAPDPTEQVPARQPAPLQIAHRLQLPLKQRTKLHNGGRPLLRVQ